MQNSGQDVYIWSHRPCDVVVALKQIMCVQVSSGSGQCRAAGRTCVYGAIDPVMSR